MNQLEQQLHYPFGDTLPESGKTMEIAPGVLWIRMGLPFALNHINLWLLEDEVETETGRIHGWTVVDCGISSDATRDSWEVLLGDKNNHLRGLPIVRVIVTHCRTDDVRQSAWRGWYSDVPTFPQTWSDRPYHAGTDSGKKESLHPLGTNSTGRLSPLTRRHPTEHPRTTLGCHYWLWSFTRTRLPVLRGTQPDDLG